MKIGSHADRKLGFYQAAVACQCDLLSFGKLICRNGDAKIAEEFNVMTLREDNFLKLISADGKAATHAFACRLTVSAIKIAVLRFALQNIEFGLIAQQMAAY